MSDNVFEGDLGWVRHCVLSRASFRRLPFSGQKFFTVISLRINNSFAKKRGIGKKLLLTTRAVMLDENVDSVAGDFNGDAWRRTTSASTLSIIEEPFVDCDLLLPPGSTPLWGPGAVPGTWSDVCGFLEPPESDRHWKVRQHGAFPFPHDALGIRQTDQSCHHEVWLHLDFVERRGSQSHHEKTQSTISVERTFSAVPLQQTERSHKRGYKRPFAVLVTGRPLAPSSGLPLPTTRAARVSSTTDQ